MAITCQSPFKPITVPKAAPVFVSPSPSSLSIPKQSLLRCNTSLTTVTTTEPQPIFTSVRSFAPATVANLGPGFDFLGCAVDGLGEFVSLTVDPAVRPGMLSISEISGAKLSKDPLWNCAGIAAIAAMKMLNIRSVGLSLSLEKGLPLGNGPGSSTASAAYICNNNLRQNFQEILLRDLSKINLNLFFNHDSEIIPFNMLRILTWG